MPIQRPALHALTAGSGWVQVSTISVARECTCGVKYNKIEKKKEERGDCVGRYGNIKGSSNPCAKQGEIISLVCSVIYNQYNASELFPIPQIILPWTNMS